MMQCGDLEQHSFMARMARGAFACSLAASCMPVASAAFAEDIDTNPEADALQAQVERTATAYDEAVEAALAADESLSANTDNIAKLEAELPAQQARSDAAARELYKLQRQSLNIVDLILGADDFFDFLSGLDYMNRVTKTNVAEIARLNEMKAELESMQIALEQEKLDANARMLEAERALTAAQEARLEAQRQAQEAARQAAESSYIAKSAAGTADSEASSAADAADEAVAAMDDGADWSSDEATFVESWGARIDAYLEGSPLAGQGRTFAQAAWNYGVDPRWSPAIAYTESSLGAACFMPHNAWGWGSASWDSWEEAIDEHVRGLARGYGYTISEEAAKKYCPPTWESWYNKTLNQMNMI